MKDSDGMSQGAGAPATEAGYRQELEIRVRGVDGDALELEPGDLAVDMHDRLAWRLEGATDVPFVVVFADGQPPFGPLPADGSDPVPGPLVLRSGADGTARVTVGQQASGRYDYQVRLDRDDAPEPASGRLVANQVTMAVVVTGSTVPVPE